MKRTILILIAFPLAAFAQPTVPGQDPRVVEMQLEANDRLQVLSTQRNEQADRVVLMAAEIAKLTRALEAAKKECKPEEKK